ncbi:MAG: hypothetical protein KatS3mg059_0390 [Thermomicrobiales bacterium]|nr:MAG: hypothetical protein KatS3mg059_0390 [Thermomicrobiales bacterium]
MGACPASPLIVGQSDACRAAASWWPMNDVGSHLSPSARGSVVELAELIRGAQEAMDRGDFLLAANACAHALESYPACLAAHRLRGEALLERGELDAAVEHFERVLTYDPLHVVAHLGLGVAAEERHDTEHAYVHYLHAWEINPALDQVREQLVKLRIALGGPERLHPTRVGLAHIHARTGQFGRAAAEWRAILAADPRNAQAKTALMEVEWRCTDDAAALALCQEVLRAEPDNVRALAIQAEIEQRQRGQASAELVARYRAIDPLGEIAALLAELRPEWIWVSLRLSLSRCLISTFRLHRRQNRNSPPDSRNRHFRRLGPTMCQLRTCGIAWFVTCKAMGIASASDDLGA